MPKKKPFYEYIKEKSKARAGSFYQRFELREGDCFPSQMVDGMIAKLIEKDLNSVADQHRTNGQTMLWL